MSALLPQHAMPSGLRWEQRVARSVVSYLNADMQDGVPADVVLLPIHFGAVLKPSTGPPMTPLAAPGAQKVIGEAIPLQPDARRLVRFFCQPWTADAADYDFAKNTLIKHSERVRFHVEDLGLRLLARQHARRSGHVVPGAVQKAMGQRQIQKARIAKEPPLLWAAIDLATYLDLIVAFLLRFYEPWQSRSGQNLFRVRRKFPIRLCKGRGCDKFVARIGKRKFHSKACGDRHYKPSRKANREYEYLRRMRKQSLGWLAKKLNEDLWIRASWQRRIIKKVIREKKAHRG